MNLFNKIWSFVLVNKIATVFTVLVLVVVFSYLGISGSQNGEEKYVVSKGEIMEEVAVTGRVKPVEDISMAFEKSGRVAYVNKKVGDRAVAGALVVSLDNADIYASLDQAKASVKSAEAKLAELKNGTRPEDINISEIVVQNTTNNVVNNIKSSYVNADDAIRNKVDQMMSNSKSSNPKLNFTLPDSQLLIEIENGRSNMESILTSWNTSIVGLSSLNGVYQYINEAKNNLRLVQLYLDKIALAVNSLTVSYNFSQTTIDSYKAAIILGRINVTTALDNLAASDEKLRNAESGLALKKAGTVPEQIAYQKAEVDGARANVLNLEAQIAKTVMRSPINGIITKQDAKVGEIAYANIELVSLISDSNFEIKVDVPELDIARIKIGNDAKITMDAYGSDTVFAGNVVAVDPAETIVDNVPKYKVTLVFKDKDERIKSGLTANVYITTNKKSDALTIPSRALLSRSGKKYVNVEVNGKEEEKEISLGIRGNRGYVEVLSGLEEGDTIIIPNAGTKK